jgi:glycosyltransferase involved in cell wall biosynthesis
VAEAFPDHADADVSGFEAKVFLDLPSSVERRISLRVRLHGELGEWTSPARSCIVHTEAVDRNDERLSTELTKRSQWLLARTEPIRNPRHAFVFAHSLRVGGGALWLQELLLGLIKRHGWTITLATALDGPLRSDCEQLEIPVHLTHPCDPSTVAAYEGQVAELALLARASGAGVGLVNTLGAFTGSAAIKRAGLPLAWTVHESFPISTLSYDEWNASGVNPVVRTRWEQALGEADELLFVSHATKEMFERYSSSRKTRVIRYGSPWVRFHGETGKDSKERARKQLGLPLDATILLNVGIMEPRKNQIGLISALERLRPAHPDLMLAVVGYHPSPYGLACQELVSRAHQNSWVKLVDVHPDPLLWFQAADFFVNNSDVESLPRSILEAICCGLPVLASDIFGAREIISDTETGWLFEPNDINALTIAIKRALETPGTKRQEMTKAAYQRVSDWLDPAVYVAEYSNILTRLAQEKP